MSAPGRPDPPRQLKKVLEDWRKRIADREHAEDDLRQALAITKFEYDAAKKRFDQAVSQAQDTGMMNSDGVHGMNIAIRDYNQALGRYKDALKGFNDFLFGNDPRSQKSEDS
jgi:tetratricopeptide (TPR) repeat protein